MAQSSFNGFLRPVPDKKGVGGIKSIQSGIAIINASTVNQPIAAVDTTKSIVVITYGGALVTGQNISQYLASAQITTSTNLQFTITGIAGQPRVAWQVIEFYSVKSLQTGITAMPGTTLNVPISTVNLSKAALFFSFKDSSGSSAVEGPMCNGSLTTASQITFAQPLAAAKSMYWQVVEFY